MVVGVDVRRHVDSELAKVIHALCVARATFGFAHAYEQQGGKCGDDRDADE